jgi:hypothetical protein
MPTLLGRPGRFVKQAGDLMTAAGVFQPRHDGGTRLEGLRVARVKDTARWRIDGAGHFPFQDNDGAGGLALAAGEEGVEGNKVGEPVPGI